MARSPDASFMIAFICSGVSSVRSSFSCATAATPSTATRPRTMSPLTHDTSIHPLPTVSSGHQSCHPPLRICDGLPSPAASLADDAGGRARHLRLRAGRSDPRAGARAGPHAAASRRGYRAGDLERLYASLPIEEDFFVNYGFVTQAVHRLMHPRSRARTRAAGRASQGRRADAILDFVGARGAVHPREVDSQFAHGRVTNYWGGSSNATTHLLDLMHYRGLLRVVRRDAGVRVYGIAGHAFSLATDKARARPAPRRAGGRGRAEVRPASRSEPVGPRSRGCATRCRTGRAT